MSFQHEFTGRTDGITCTTPALSRQLDGITTVFWQAGGTRGAQGYYLSRQPRIMVFFNDMTAIRVSNEPGTSPRRGRPLPRLLYVPAGLPMWTAFTDDHAFSHLDIHLEGERLLKMLSPALGRPEAQEILRQPVEGEIPAAVEALAGLILDETRSPTRHPLHMECLVASLVTRVLDLGGSQPDRQDSRLTKGQMRKLVERFRAGGGRSLTVAELAETVGLSESWFFHRFKNTTGTTPLQWQLRQRVELARAMLGEGGLSVAEIADRLGFTDQAHLTRVFRQVTGETPAAWRRARADAR